MGKFPERTFGIDGLGGNAVEGQGSSADAEVRDTSVRGTDLYLHPRIDRYVTEHTRKWLDDDEYSTREAEKHEAEEEFRGRAGFVNTIS